MALTRRKRDLPLCPTRYTALIASSNSQAGTGGPLTVVSFRGRCVTMISGFRSMVTCEQRTAQETDSGLSGQRWQGELSVSGS